MATNRARYITEAVLSGYEALGGKTEFTTLMQSIYRIMTDWFAYGDRKTSSLVTRLNDNPTVQNSFVTFRSDEGRGPKGYLFTKGGYLPHSMKVLIHVSPTYKMQSQRDIGQHISFLRATLQHEFSHMQQFALPNDAEQETRFSGHLVMNTMGKANWSVPAFKEFARSEITQRLGPGQDVRFGRAVPVNMPGGKHPYAGSWYQALPEEIMAWAIGVGVLIAALQRKSVQQIPLVHERLINDLHQIFDRLNPGGTGDSQAFKRFKKNLLEYLINHENYAPHIAATLIADAFRTAHKYYTPQRTG